MSPTFDWIEKHGAPDAHSSKDLKGIRILVIRPDRLGDVILSTPVFEAIKKHYPDSFLAVMVRREHVPILRGLPFVDELLVYDPQTLHAGISGFFRLFQKIRKGRFRMAIVLQSQIRIAWAVFLAGIRYRIGPLSKLHSFLLFNRGVRQGRSRVEMHETDYNLQLLRRLGIRTGTRSIQPSVSISDETKKQGRAWLEAQGWNSAQPLVVIHPAMGGSALNWPESQYQSLVESLAQSGRQVLLTAGKSEADLLIRIAKAIPASIPKPWVYYPEQDQSIEFLGGLFHWAQLIVVPSTGPLHLAVALGKRVVTFYSPIRVQSAIRWGPYRQQESRSSILVPEVYCGEDFRCRGTLCNYFPCMKGLTVPQAVEQVDWQLSQEEG